jgi:hypothetical protein
MGNSPDRNSIEWDQQYLLAKTLLIHYGVMHAFFEQQLYYYTIACSNISIGGTFKLHPESRTIMFDLKTEKSYKKDKSTKKIVKRNAISSFFKVLPKKYKQECDITVKNLTEWTQKLMWSDTTVKVIIDGYEQ